MPLKEMAIPTGSRPLPKTSQEVKDPTRKGGSEERTAPREERTAPRKESGSQGYVRIPGYRLNLACRVANISATGARLEFFDAKAHHLPDRVVVVFPGDRMEIDAKIKWRNDKVCGVRFVSLFRRTQALPKSG